MTATFVDGYDVAITIDAATTIIAVADSFDVNESKPITTKAFFGGSKTTSRGGQKTGTYSLTGLVTQENNSTIWALLDSDAAFVVTWWSTGDTTSFSGVTGDISASADPDSGEVSFSISGTAAAGFTHA